MGNKSTQSFEVARECPDCGATGVFVGMSERNGDAVVCSTCSGTGRHLFRMEYRPFTKRRKRKGVLRVLATNPGICSAPGVVSGGVSYAAWLEDSRGVHARGAEMRSHTCPAWWYQGADYDRKPGWDECLKLGMFSECQHFGDKAKCWERFDREGL